VKDGGEKIFAAGFAVFAHLAVVGAVWGGTHLERSRQERRAAADDGKKNHIEAGLAVRSKSAKGRKSKQPQKDVARKVSPNDVTVKRDDKPADPNKPKPDEKDPLGDVDPESVFNKHRPGAEGDVDPATAEPGADDESKAGRADGSDFGTLEDAKGDPYVGELIGRMTTNPDIEIPATVPEGTGLVTYGCVRLSADGKIVEAELDPDHKSGNAAFNSAVLRRVKATTDMEAPVPDKLKKMLVENSACVPFRY